MKKILVLTVFVLVLIGLFAIIFFDKDSADYRVQHKIINFHSLEFFDEQLFSNGVDQAKKEEPFSNLIKGGVIPHHLLPGFIISDFFQQLSHQKVKTIFLIGPNHYGRGVDNIITSDWGWETPFGEVNPALEEIKFLSDEGAVVINNEFIGHEHSVAGIMPYLSYYLPKVEVVPIIINPRISRAEINRLAINLARLGNQPEQIIISSIDFSHYLTSELAKKKNEETLLAIESADYEKLLSLDNDYIDSPQSLVALMKAMDAMGVSEFKVRHDTNSGDLTQTSGPGVTSYLGILFYRGKSSGDGKVNILFGGDVMFDRYIRQVSETKGYDFLLSDGIKSVVSKSDLTIVNLEGPITGNSSVSVNTEMGSPDNYKFTFSEESVNFLLRNNFKIVNLGNNHLMDFGSDGVSYTKKILRASGIKYFGDILGEERNEAIIESIGGVTIALVNYNAFKGGSKERAIREIASSSRRVDFVVVYAHWGREYQSSVSERTRIVAHKFIEKGADLIIGSHPHVIQEKEVYQGKEIYYSLGNFVFDQYFSEEIRRGMLVEASFDRNLSKIDTKDLLVNMKETGQVVLD